MAVEWIAHHSDFAVAPMKSRSRLHHRLRYPRWAAADVVASKNRSTWAEWLILENGKIEKEKMYQFVLASLIMGANGFHGRKDSRNAYRRL